MKLDFDIEGLDELENSLALLDLATQNKSLRKAVREMAKPVKQNVEQRISSAGLVDTGALLNDVKIRVHTDKRNTKFYDVGATVGIGRENAYVAYWLENGVEPHILNPNAKTKDGRPVNFQLMHPGLKPKPFLRPSLDENKDQVIQISQTVLKTAIDKALK